MKLEIESTITDEAMSKAEALLRRMPESAFVSCPAVAVLAFIAEIRRLRSHKCANPNVEQCAREWQENTNRRQLEAVSKELADEFGDMGCDAMEWVAEELVASREEIRRLRALTTPIPLAEREPPDGRCLVWCCNDHAKDGWWDDVVAEGGEITLYPWTKDATHWLPCPPDPTK